MKIASSLDFVTAVRIGEYPEMIIPLHNIEMGGRWKHSAKWWDATYSLVPAGTYSSRTIEGIESAQLNLSGTDLAAWRRAGWSDGRILNHLEKEGAKLTRLDYAVDVFEVASHPSELVDAWDSGKKSGAARAVSIYDAREGGYTAYFGSRQSERFVRVYDKAAEQKLEGVRWTRIELQCRKERAEALAQAMRQYGKDAAGKTEIRSLVDFQGVDWWRLALAHNALVQRATIPRAVPSHVKWLRSQVASVFRKSYDEKTLDQMRAWLKEMGSELDRYNR